RGWHPAPHRTRAAPAGPGRLSRLGWATSTPEILGTGCRFRGTPIVVAARASISVDSKAQLEETVAMTNVNPWDAIHHERAALARDVADLNEEQWRTRSLCGDWTVQQVLGHMTAAASTNPAKWLVRFAGTGFRFNTLVNND